MDNIRAVFRIIGQLRYILSDKQKKESAIVFLTMVICSVMELLGVSVIYPFLEVLIDAAQLENKWYLRWIFKLFPNINSNHIIILLCFIIIAVYFVKNIATLWCRYYQNRFAAAFQRELSTTILQSFLKRPYEYFLNNNSAKIREHIHGDVYATYNVLLSLFEFMAELLTVFAIGIYLIYTDWAVAIAALFLAFGCFLATILLFKKKLKLAGREMTIVATEQSKASHQAIYGIKEISVSNRRGYFVDAFNASSKKVEKITVQYNFLSSCPDRILEAVCIGGFIGIACTRIALGADPSKFIPVLGAFAMGAFKILPSISKMASRINGVVYNQTRLSNCYNNIMEVRRYEEETQKLVCDKGLDSKQIRDSFEDSIVLKDVSWKYQNSDVYVLNQLNITIRKGEAVALVGASGAGKTTLADVVLGLFQPQSGQIFMDGVDIRTIPNSWCKIVGYVPQSVFLIDDTIRANIAFGISRESIDDNKVWNALEQAHLADYVRGMPEGLDTIVGERGLKLSGGQRQRIAIARALYDNPDVLILDEATSALDVETENAVMESIESLLGQKTMIIIAHRLTTIRNCDTIYEIKDGQAWAKDKSDVLATDLMR